MFKDVIPFEKKHVVITGGSAGIGLCIAEEAIKKKANVTLIARTTSKLKEAQEQLQSLSSSQKLGSVIRIQTADVTSEEQIKQALVEAATNLGPVDILICNAGAATPGYFHQTDLAAHRRTMDLNYFGVLNTVHAVYPSMIRRGTGHICLVSSPLGMLGMIGYSTYSPSKYAVRGLADSLRNELQGSGVSVSLAVPPDTDTPGFKTENESKPLETKIISEAGATLFKPEKVAKMILFGIRSGAYLLPTPDPGLQLHCRASVGIVPRKPLELVVDFFIGIIAPIVQSLYAVLLLDRVSKKYAGQRFADLRENK
mmetsp:Transcript_32727/g.59313  ORF Transcript_32727/g.59313 Transcript_32727/m.59313 type:complete len:312 (-) Transcript_32727:492-1427(-)